MTQQLLQQVADHTFSSLHRMLQARFKFVSPTYTSQSFECMNNSVRHDYKCYTVDINSHHFLTVQSILENADQHIKLNYLSFFTLFFIVRNIKAGDALLERIEKIENFIPKGNIAIALVITSSRDFGPISIHDEISFKSINAFCRNLVAK